MVPTTVIERRMGTRCVQSKGIVMETYTAFEKVLVPKTVIKTECYLVDKVKTRIVENMVCYLVELPVEIVHPVQNLRVKGTKGSGEPEATEPVTEHCTRTVVAIGTIKREVEYCVKVPKFHSTKCADILTYELRPIQRQREIHVSVPRIETYPIEVEVCKMVPKKVACCSTCVRHHK
jgi:hypothetical protein